MRTTIGRMLGTLLESFFDVTVAASKTEHLAQLCSSTVMTGYLFRNVQQRLELQQQMGDLDGGLLVFLLPCSFMVACLGASEQPDSQTLTASATQAGGTSCAICGLVPCHQAAKGAYVCWQVLQQCCALLGAASIHLFTCPPLLLRARHFALLDSHLWAYPAPHSVRTQSSITHHDVSLATAATTYPVGDCCFATLCKFPSVHFAASKLGSSSCPADVAHLGRLAMFSSSASPHQRLV